MDRNRLMMLLAVVTGVAVVALGFLIGVQPQLSSASAAAEQQATVEQQNDELRATLAQLQAENEKLPELKTELASREASVPTTASMPALIRELNDMAVASRTTVTGFTTADAVAYELPASATAPAPTADASSEATDEASAPATDAASATPAAPAAVTNPLVTSTNFSSIAVTVDVRGTYDQALDFVSRLQKGSRLFLVTTITSSDESDEGADGSTAIGQTWTVGGLVFVLQNAAATQADQAADATPATPASGAEGDGSSETAAGK